MDPGGTQPVEHGPHEPRRQFPAQHVVVFHQPAHGHRVELDRVAGSVVTAPKRQRFGEKSHDHTTTLPGPMVSITTSPRPGTWKPGATSPRAPGANAFAERRVRAVRSECLYWTLIWNRQHLQRILTAYVEHCNMARPHRGLELDVPVPAPMAIVTALPTAGRCRTRRHP